MKKIIILSLLLITANYTEAQITFPVDILQSLCDYNLSEFETYMLQKDYYKDNDITNATVTMYQSNQKRANNKRDQCSMYKSVSKPVMTNVTVGTTDKAYYLTAKEYLASAGYELVKTETVKMLGDEVPWYYYSNKKFTVLIYSYTQMDGIVWYSVQVSKN